jgi:AhpD family alkylhydroperoxidase
MQARLDPFAVAPDLMQGMVELEQRVRGSGLEPSLIELVKLRASQLNGCAFCLDMHATDARRHGETNARIDLLPAWREAPVYNERERAALAWTESLTLVAQTHAADADYELVCEHFGERERVALTLLVCTINAWNRIAIGFRRPPALKG